MLELLLSGAGGGGPTGNTWTKLVAAGAPAAVDQMAVATYKADVYFLGGYDNTAQAETAACYKYSIKDNAFTPIANMPLPLRLHRVVAGVGKLYVWGGLSTSGYVTVFYEYTISTNAWRTLTVPTAATSPGSANVQMTNIGTDIYIMGGAQGNASVNGSANMVKYDTIANTWTARAAFPNAISNGCMNAADDKLFVAYGNYNNGANFQLDLVAYDPVANTWSVKLANIVGSDSTRYGAKSAIFGSSIQYWAGSAVNNNIVGYDYAENTFAPNLGIIKTEVRPGTGFVAQNKFYSLGSTTGTEFWVYDPYAGKPKPSLVIIPYQEFYSATEFCTAFSMPATAASPVTQDGLNWILMRFDNQTWILPQKSLRKTADKASANYIGGRAVTANGVSYRISGIPNPTEASTGNWAKLFGRVTLNFNPTATNGIPKLAKFSNATLGFSPACYEWTTLSNGAYETQCVGGTSPSGIFSLHNTADRANLRPLILVNSPSLLPW